MRVRIYKSTGSLYIAFDEQGQRWTCKIKGKFKIDKEISSSNPIAVGDWVNIAIEDEEKLLGVIDAIEPRKNYIVRTSPHNKHQKHIVASNIDQAILITTLKQPITSFGFIDRFLITAALYHIPVLIIINKADLITESLHDDWEYRVAVYESIGYPVLTINALDEKDINLFTSHLNGKISLLSGHSGVGKSTIINHCLPDYNLRVQDVSASNGKGQHTTTFAEMFNLPDRKGAIIDTPGVKEFGLVDVSKYELSHYFLEMQTYLPSCKFNNCMHVNEPDCAVKNAVEQGAIAIERYESYLSMLESIM